MLKIKVKGYSQAKSILDELPNNLQKRILLSALKSSAKPMLASARNKVPTKTGTLKKQLRVVRFKDRNAKRSEVSVAVKPYFDRYKKKGTINQYYGKFIHEGTKNPRKSKRGKILVFKNQQGKLVFTRSVKGIKATPFLERAYSDSNSRTIQIFGDELAKSVSKFISRNFKPIK